jgi:hypothetical protein
MTDGSGNYIPMPAATPPAGWYPDPAGTPRQRWWNGVAWTEDLQYPEPPVYGRLAPTAVGPDTPVYGAYIWIIVLLPVLSLITFTTMDLGAILNQAVTSPTGSPYTPAYVLNQFLGLAGYGATVTLAYFDRRRLISAGFTRPFHWAWAFLYSGVYVIGRSVVVRNSAGRGLAPLWVWAGILTLSTVLSIAKLMAFLPLLQLMIDSSSSR